MSFGDVQGKLDHLLSRHSVWSTFHDIGYAKESHMVGDDCIGGHVADGAVYHQPRGAPLRNDHP